MTIDEREKKIEAAENDTFLILHWAKRSADNGNAEHALHLAQTAAAIAQAVSLLKIKSG